jgi:hypothetical protein
LVISWAWSESCARIAGDKRSGYKALWQARVNAHVVPIASKVSGTISAKPRIEKIEHEIRGQLRQFSSVERAAWSLQAFNYGDREEET